MMHSKKDTLSSGSSKTVRCPQCRRQAIYDASNPNRPFCSERCKLIDLGAWASNQYAIPGEPVDPTPTSDEDA